MSENKPPVRRGRPTAQRLALILWTRFGDGGEYDNHDTDFPALADVIHEHGIAANDIAYLNCPRNPTDPKNYTHYLPRAGFVTKIYGGNNYVSLYWGDSEGNLVQPLTRQDEQDLLTRLRRLETRR